MKVGDGPFILEGVLRDPDGNPIRGAKLTLRNARFPDIVLGSGVSSSEGAYRFVGFPRVNCILEVEEPGKWKRTVYVNIIEKITGIPTHPGMVLPMDLTVPHLEAPAVTYKVVPPPMPDIKLPEIPAYKPDPLIPPEVGYA